MLLLKSLQEGDKNKLEVANNKCPHNHFPVFLSIGVEGEIAPCIGLTKIQTLELIEELKLLIV